MKPARREIKGLLAVAGLALSLPAVPASGADLGGGCCSDLEERIAELEATTARKGNRRVSLTVSGHVNKALLAWDDSFERNIYVVGNKNDQTNLAFAGDAEIASGWKTGYTIVVRFTDNLSDSVDQSVDSASNGFFMWQAHWWVESQKLGKVSAGLASRVSDTAPESDLSEAGVAGYAGVQDVGGGFLLRRGDGAFAAFTWGNVYNHFNGDTANLVRWDSPEVGGFVVAASWGEDDVWDVGVHYSHEGQVFTFDASVAFTQVTDPTGPVGTDPDSSTLVGSLSLLHTASGLNLTFSAGHREWDGTLADADGVNRTPLDTEFVYAKIGWIAHLHSLGPTAFYTEYGRFKDFVTAGVDADGVASLSLTDIVNGGCAIDGAACRVAGNEAEVWGLGVVQHVEAAEMQLYLGCRHHSAHFDLVDNDGHVVASSPLEDFDTVIGGAKVAF